MPDSTARRVSAEVTPDGGSVINLRTRWRDSHVITNAGAFVGFRYAYPN